ncbi:MAG TPA: DUF4352 domain-containing protein [Streptosporangiaceae bacterium]
MPDDQPQWQDPSQQQPRKKRHLIRNVLAGFGALVVVIIVIAAVSSKGGVSTTPSGSATGATRATMSAPAHTTTAVVGSSFQVSDGSGDNYRVTLSKVIDPAQGADSYTIPDNGKRFVGIVFTITALNGSPQDEDANTDAAVVGSNGQTYTADFDSIAGYTNFDDGSINVAQGDTVQGAVTFQVPDGVRVAEVQWSPGGFGATVQWDAHR